MKALTIHEPWATLIARGIKRVENRNWTTSLRGRFAIHAGKKVHWDLVELYNMAEHIRPGHILCTVELAEIVPLETVGEHLLGGSHFAIGPLCWILRDPQPWRGESFRLGQQGLWTV